MLFVLSTHSFAQIIVTNKIGRAEALKIVSQLPKGMRHADALKVLERNGLRGESGGPSFHHTWFRCYSLADGDSLALGYLPPLRHTNDFLAQLAESRLAEAHISNSNGVRIIEITLINAPTN